MQKFISKYATAAHLALLAVAPLILSPFFKEEVVADVLLWLSAITFVWVLMEPSRRLDEMLHDARSRVVRSVWTDHVFWIALAVVIILAIAALNTGVSLACERNDDRFVWTIQSAFVPILPGSVSGCGYLPFAVSIAALTVITGCRHALGKAARASFLFSASFLAGLSGVVFAVVSYCGNVTITAFFAADWHEPSFMGFGYLLYFLSSIAVLPLAAENRWLSQLPLFLIIIAIGGTSLGLVLFAPPLIMLVAAIALIPTLLFVLVYRFIHAGMLPAFRLLAVFLLSLTIPFLTVEGLIADGNKDLVAKFESVGEKHFLCDNYDAGRKLFALSAEKSWKVHPWLGSGIGSHPLTFRFNASQVASSVDKELGYAADQHTAISKIVSPMQKGSFHGWWLFITERGLIGLLSVAAIVVLLLSTVVLRSVSKGFKSALNPVVFIALVALGVEISSGFHDVSFLRPEAVLAVGAFLALAGASIPAPKKKTGDDGAPKL